MDFRFENKIGDVTVFTHTAEALQEMVKTHGIHVIYDFEDGTSDADTEYIYDPETLIKEFPHISHRAAEKFFAGEAEIDYVQIDGETYTVSLHYPIPEIGYEGEDE